MSKSSLLNDCKPRDLQVKILHFLEIEELLELLCVSKYMQTIIAHVPVKMTTNKIISYDQFEMSFVKFFPSVSSVCLSYYIKIDYELPTLFSSCLRNVKELVIKKPGSYFANLPKLERLTVCSIYKLEEYLPLLPSLKNLNFLKIDYDRVEDDGYDTDDDNHDAVNSNKDFRYVDLSQYIPKIKTLHIRYRHKMPNSFISNFHNLEELCLVYCHKNITSDAFINLKKLERLYIRDNYNITDDAFEHLPQLKLLHFESQNRLTDRAFQYLVNLETLKYFGSDTNFTDDAFVNLKNLTNLSCRYDKNITSKIFVHLPKLKFLDILECTQLLVKETFDKLPRLEYLDVRSVNHCEHADKFIKPEKNIFKKLRVKHLNLDASYMNLSRKDFDDLVKNGLQTLNIVRDETEDTRFSPFFQKRIILSKDNVKKFLKIVRKLTYD